MKTQIGGDRLGSGNKEEVSIKNYSRSTHDLSYVFRSTMSSGTLVPFLNEVALPGDTWEIDLNCDVKTLPTVGPLFGSYKVQLDVFEAPVRLYQGKLHMNMINIGMDMGEIKLPQYRLQGEYDPDNVDEEGELNDQMFLSPSSIFSYLGVEGIGRSKTGLKQEMFREFNAVPWLAYWEIYGNYYANKQQTDNDGKDTVGAVIHQTDYENYWTVTNATCSDASTKNADILTQSQSINWQPGEVTVNIEVGWGHPGEPYGNFDINQVAVSLSGGIGDVFLTQAFYVVDVQHHPNGIPSTVPGNNNVTYYTITAAGFIGSVANGTYNTSIGQVNIENTANPGGGRPIVQEFPLKHINKMRENLLTAVNAQGAYVIDYDNESPYGWALDCVGGGDDSDNWKDAFAKGSQEGLAIKTYQSDIFNSFIDSEWIEGNTGVGEVSAVVVQSRTYQGQQEDVIYMDSLNLQQKVYNMLNRIAVSGGSYDDWLDAVYTHERAKGVESPVYHGSLIKELTFEEVISQSDVEVKGNQQPLGTLAGRGRLTGKHKGGRMKIKVSEPSVLIGIVSLTPRVDYSGGIKFSSDLKTMNDFYKPELGAIGFQDLITSQMHWAGDEVDANGNVTHESAGKQPAWLNYMTNYNVCKGNFAIKNNSMFMTLNRRYEQGGSGIKDVTTYIDPSKFNHIFSQTSVDAQNFWVQIGADIKARRKMSAKVIPNL